MAIEIELKLSLSPATARALRTDPLLAGLMPQRQVLLNTYYDTPDLALTGRCVALRFRKKGWQTLLTVKSAEPSSGGLAVRSEWEYPATPGVFDFSPVANEGLRTCLEALRPALTPIFATDFRRDAFRIAHGNSVIELAIDRGHLLSCGRREKLCEIELELIEGDIADLFSLTRTLQARHLLSPSVESKAERGYRLFRNAPPSPFKARPIRISDRQTPVDAFRAVALGCLQHFLRNEAGLLADGEPEYVHQARVALRRLRSAIKLFGPALPPDFIATYGPIWRSLAGALGEARNWDVFTTETLPPIEAAFPHDAGLRRLRREGLRRARHARQAVRKLLSTREYPQLMTEFTAAVYALESTGCPTPLKAFARDRLAAHVRSARKLAQVYDSLDAEQRHQMRLRFKKLRYALEFLAPILAGGRLKSRIAALSALQETLGLINDQVTAEMLIASALPKLPPGPIQGWLAGRSELLVKRVPEALDAWLDDAAARS